MRRSISILIYLLPIKLTQLIMMPFPKVSYNGTVFLLDIIIYFLIENILHAKLLISSFRMFTDNAQGPGRLEQPVPGGQVHLRWLRTTYHRPLLLAGGRSPVASGMSSVRSL